MEGYWYSSDYKHTRGTTRIHVRKNNRKVFIIANSNWEYGNNVAAIWIWKMKKGEALNFSVEWKYVWMEKGFPLVVTGELIGSLPALDPDQVPT